MSRRRRILIFLLLMLLASCSPQRRQTLVRALFDDPPRPSRADSTAVRPTRESDREPTVVDIAASRHAPFAAQDCSACHSLNASKSFPRDVNPAEGTAAPLPRASIDTGQQTTRLRFETGTLCYKCHTQMTVDELLKENAVIHGAITQGLCGSCHDPHESRFPKLLTRGDPIADLCFFCHEESMVLEIEDHADGARRDCLQCHDPHASRHRHLLRQPGQAEPSTRDPES